MNNDLNIGLSDHNDLELEPCTILAIVIKTVTGNFDIMTFLKLFRYILSPCSITMVGTERTLYC